LSSQQTGLTIRSFFPLPFVGHLLPLSSRGSCRLLTDCIHETACFRLTFYSHNFEFFLLGELLSRSPSLNARKNFLIMFDLRFLAHQTNFPFPHFLDCRMDIHFERIKPPIGRAGACLALWQEPFATPPPPGIKERLRF